MPCSSCGSEFGIFKKEHSCKNCGFSFCGNCLNKKMVIPKLGTQAKHSVCGSCFHQLNSKSDNTEKTSGRISPPMALQRRMNEIQSQQSSSSSTRPHGDSKDDQIASRLEKLRKERQGGPVPSTGEIEARLARLKEMPANDDQANMRALREKDKRSNTEKAADLFKQMEEEVKLDAKRVKPEDEISNRLAMLKHDNVPWNDLNKPGVAKEQDDIDPENYAGPSKDQTTPTNHSNLPINISSDCLENMNFDEVKKLIDVTSKELDIDAKNALSEVDQQCFKDVRSHPSARAATRANNNNNNNSSVSFLSDDEDDDDDADDNMLTEKLIKKLLAEQALDESCQGMFHESKETNISQQGKSTTEIEDELPWCNICNEDAAVRCLQCDGELYCHRCFNECHDSFEIKDHRTVPYK